MDIRGLGYPGDEFKKGRVPLFDCRRCSSKGQIEINNIISKEQICNLKN